MKHDNNSEMQACIGEQALREYLERCGNDITSYFMYFDTYILDIDELYKMTGKYPSIMFTTEDFNRVEFNRILAYNRIRISRDEDLWLQSFCRRMLDSWIDIRRQHDIIVHKITPPIAEEYLSQRIYRWVTSMINRTI